MVWRVHLRENALPAGRMSIRRWVWRTGHAADVPYMMSPQDGSIATVLKSHRPAAHAKRRFDTWRSARHPGRPAVRPFEPASKSGTEAPRVRHRARTDRSAFTSSPDRLAASSLARSTPSSRSIRPAMFVTDSITAILLYAQFSILRSRAVLRDRKRLPVYRVPDRPVCAGISRRAGDQTALSAACRLARTCTCCGTAASRYL